MFKAINGAGQYTFVDHVVPGTKYYCPICKGELVVKAQKSEKIAAHFAHKSIKDCDTFSHDMSDWHKAWQKRFPEKNQEVPLPFDAPCHRADVLAYGYVIEFQHSPISAEEFEERNRFYTSLGKKVVWIFDVSDKYANNRFSKVEPEYAFCGYYVDSNGATRKRWFVKDFRIATTFGALSGPPEALEDNGIDYKYGRNIKHTRHKTFEWNWTRPMNNLIHYNPLVEKNVIVFLEFQPGALHKVVWCDEEFDDYKAGIIAESIHGRGAEQDDPSIENYMKYRQHFVIRSCFNHFSATEYTVRDFLLEIKNQQL